MRFIGAKSSRGKTQKYSGLMVNVVRTVRITVKTVNHH